MTAPNLNILFSDAYSMVNTVFFLSKPLKAKATTTNKKETNKKIQQCLDFSL